MNLKFRNSTKAELREACTCSDDPENGACEACCILGALDAGIPRSVVFGEKKLNEVFSESYIDFKCNRQSEEKD